MYGNSSEAKRNGWHSRRHQTTAGRDEARRQWEAKQKGKLVRAEQRAAERAARSPEQQLQVLADRIGEANVPGCKEGKRLIGLVAQRPVEERLTEETKPTKQRRRTRKQKGATK